MKIGSVLVRGFITGMLLQLAIGPVFIYIINTAIQSGFISGITSVIAVTAADYIYIILAILGTGKLLENQKIKRVLIIISSSVLIVFGVLLIKNGICFNFSGESGLLSEKSTAGSFLSAFILTISSPLTIVFWSGVFTAKAVEYSLNKKELIIFGLSAGAATFLFLGICVSAVSAFNLMIPLPVFHVLNVLVGLILILYGLVRLKDSV